jgi:D-glycero-D-manno-heptose 1,7-bisphosphate phosphatase
VKGEDIAVGGTGSKKAAFLDRDGVLIEDRGVLIHSRDIHVIKGAGAALRQLKDAGFLIVVVSNQTAVARGLLSPAEVLALEQAVELRLGGTDKVLEMIDGFYFCPHHPNATVPAYRRDCTCRKPAPGLLLEAARALDIDLHASVMIGDRPSDVAAGKAAGCRTIQVLSGRHADPLIETTAGFAAVPPDLTCANLAEAVAHVVQGDDTVAVGIALAARESAPPMPLPLGDKSA